MISFRCTIWDYIFFTEKTLTTAHVFWCICTLVVGPVFFLLVVLLMEKNPAPVDMEDLPSFTRCYLSQLVQDFFHQQYFHRSTCSFLMLLDFMCSWPRLFQHEGWPISIRKIFYNIYIYMSTRQKFWIHRLDSGGLHVGGPCTKHW